jgi:hypothetical protein
VSTLRSGSALAAILALMVTSAAQASPPRLRVSGSVGAGYDDNIGASQANVEKESSAFYSMLIGADYTHPLSRNITVTARGHLQGDAYERFDDLSNGRAVALLRTAWKPGSGFFTPVLSGWVSGAKLEYGSEIRTGHEMRGGVFLVQPLTTKVNGRVDLKGFHRESKGRVFDLSGQSAGLSFNWLALPVLTTTIGFEYQTGDSFSTAAPTAQIAQAAEAIEPDDAFGGIEAGQFAYRIDARTRIATLGANWRLTRDWALDAQLQSVSVDGDFGNQYDRLIGTVALLVRF